MSLVETVVAMGVGSISLVLIGMLVLFGLRSFAVMGNFADLDEKGRLTVDRVSRDLREATGVLNYQTGSGGKTLVLTNALDGGVMTYVWDTDTRTLTYAAGNQPAVVCLTDCEAWNPSFFQDRPQASSTLPFLPATNGVGKLDLKLARILKMTWTCSRSVPGMKVSTDSSQSLQVVLRNSPQ